MAWALTPLTEEQREIQRVAREFAMHEIAPHSAQWDRDAYFEPSLVGKLGALGFLGMLLPEEYGGLGLDTLTYLVALEEIATVDASVAVMISATPDLARLRTPMSAPSGVNAPRVLPRSTYL